MFTIKFVRRDRHPLLKLCLLETRKASPDVVAALKENGFASAETTLTGRTARVQSKSFRIGDVAVYWDGDNCENTLVGEIYWFASIGGELLVGLSAWQIKNKLGRYRKTVVEENLPIIPSARLLQAMIFTPTEVGKIATVIMPALSPLPALIFPMGLTRDPSAPFLQDRQQQKSSRHLVSA